MAEQRQERVLATAGGREILYLQERLAARPIVQRPTRRKTIVVHGQAISCRQLRRIGGHERKPHVCPLSRNVHKDLQFKAVPAISIA